MYFGGVIEAAHSFAVFEFFGEDDSFAAIDKAEIAQAAFSVLKNTSELIPQDYLTIVDTMSIHGNAYIWEQQGDKGLPIFEQAMALRNKAIEAHPDNLNIRVMAAKFVADYGDAQSRHIDLVGGSYDQSLNAMNQGINEMSELQKQNPNKTDIKQALATLLWKTRSALLRHL